MNLLLLTENWPPRIGGIEKYLTGLIDGLEREKDIIVHVIEPSKKRIFWPVIRPAWLPLFLYIWKFVKREQIDIVLCGKALFEGLVGYYLKKYLQIPYVVFTYAMEIEMWLRNPRTHRKLVRVLKNADKVVVINDVTKKRIIDLGISVDKIVKIYPALDDQFLQRIKKGDDQGNILAKYKLPHPYILTVARLVPRKGIDDLIRAYAKLDQVTFTNIDLVIIGDGPHRKALEQVAEGEFVRPHFLGAVPDEDLPALFANARLFALTPKNVAGDIEGFGIVYLEAAAAGLPIVATRTGGVPEAVQSLPNHVLIDSGNVDAIADALIKLLSQDKILSTPNASPRYVDRAQQLLTALRQID
ncbi:MAG: glycosyltransferase family 4 protein [Candidatus Andersenbacteria bacterium]|nr:glycosyltransferase family 4 protein [Candidatus Andersenbacteria bacterium]MBI3250291.1 glycosyltransferase family 4 protein [Candidatus Andersenbacteria bacterium]